MKKRLFFNLVTILVVFIICSFSVFAQQLPDLSSVVKATEDSVVYISTTQTIKQRVPFFNFPFGANPFEGFPFFEGPNPHQFREYKSKSLGSGFIISEDGYIVTNNHVIDKADEIMVRLHNGKEYKAKKIGQDPLTDLALLKIDVDNIKLKPLKLGSSDKLEVGEWVLAVGNPFGLESSYTFGIISAKGRDLGEGPYDNFLQTDASINPGNSGGPLINLKGEVIGINTAIIASGQGLGFAIPVDTLKTILPQLKKGSVKRGFLGVTNLEDLKDEMKKALNLNIENGVIVNGVIPGEPADLAGIKEGDIIISIDEQPVKTPKDVMTIIGNTPPGKTVTIKVVRIGLDNKAEIKVFKVKLGERKDELSAQKDDQSIVVTSLTDEEKKSLRLEIGVKVADLNPASNAARAGLKKGDIILSINNQYVTDENKFYSIYRSVEKGKYILMRIYSKKGIKAIGFYKD